MTCCSRTGVNPNFCLSPAAARRAVRIRPVVCQAQISDWNAVRDGLPIFRPPFDLEARFSSCLHGLRAHPPRGHRPRRRGQGDRRPRRTSAHDGGDRRPPQYRVPRGLVHLRRTGRGRHRAGSDRRCADAGAPDAGHRDSIRRHPQRFGRLPGAWRFEDPKGLRADRRRRPVDRRRGLAPPADAPQRERGLRRRHRRRDDTGARRLRATAEAAQRGRPARHPPRLGEPLRQTVPPCSLCSSTGATNRAAPRRSQRAGERGHVRQGRRRTAACNLRSRDDGSQRSKEIRRCDWPR